MYEEEKNFNNEDKSLQNYFNLDDKISENDLHCNRLSASKKLKNTQR